MGGKPEVGSGGPNPLAPLVDQLNVLAHRVNNLERGLLREDHPQPVWPLLDWYTINPGTAGAITTNKVMTRSGQPNEGLLFVGYRRQLRHNGLQFLHYSWPVESGIQGRLRLELNGQEIWRLDNIPGGTQTGGVISLPINLPMGSSAALAWWGSHDGTDGTDTFAAMIYDVVWCDRELLGV